MVLATVAIAAAVLLAAWLMEKPRKDGLGSCPHLGAFMCVEE